MILSGTYASGFSLAMMAKDLRTADDLARHLDVPAPLSLDVPPRHAVPRRPLVSAA